MIKKKGRFLTFIFSMLPGAAHMYMGFMKQGTSIMSLFFFNFLLASWLNIAPVMFCVPIIWFYAFFDANNKAGLDDQHFYMLEDHNIFNSSLFQEAQYILTGRGKVVAAIILILLGFNTLWNSVFSLFSWILPSFLNNFIYNLMNVLPKILLSLFIILIGVKLITGKKIEIDEDFFLPNKDKHDNE